MHRGYLKLYRRIMASDLWYTQRRGKMRRASVLEAWVYLLMNAAHETYRMPSGFIIECGQLIVSIRELANEWAWGKSTVGDFLGACQKEGRITIRKTGHFPGHFPGQSMLLVTITKYELYQDTPQESPDTSPDTSPAGYVNTISVVSNREDVNNSTVNIGEELARLWEAAFQLRHHEPMCQWIRDGHPRDEIAHALRVTIEQGKKWPAYTRGILVRRAQEGYPPIQSGPTTDAKGVMDRFRERTKDA